MIPVYITDIIGEVVTSAQNAIVKKNPNRTLLQVIQANETAALESPSLIETIRYSKSSFNELLETLAQDDKAESTRNTKYPLVHLVRDFYEDRGKGNNTGMYAEVSLNIILIHQTEMTYKIEDREAKVFKPVLYPIYYEFMRQLAKHPQIQVDHEITIPHRKWDRAYWGTRQLQASKNTLNDYVDAIELQNVSLKVNFKNC